MIKFTKQFLLIVFFATSFLSFFNEVHAEVKVGQGYFNACTTSNCTQTVTLGFQPKAILFYWASTTIPTLTADASGGWGFAASTTPATPVQRVVSVASNDADTTTENSRYRSSGYSIALLDAGASSGTFQRVATTTFTSTGFQVAWTTTVVGKPQIHYMAIGGDDVLATDAGTFNVTTGTGSQSYTELSFQPDFVMFAWSFTQSEYAITAGMEIGLGFATTSGSGNQAAMVAVASDNVGANNNKRWMSQATSSILATSVASPAVTDAVVSFTSMDSNGFTVNKVDGPAATLPVYFLAIKGGKHKVGWLETPGSSGSQATTSAGFTPKGLFMMSSGATTTVAKAGGFSYGGGISLGSGTTTASSTAIWFQDFNIDSSDANMIATSSFIAIDLVRTATNLRNRASLTSLDTNGFTLNWSPGTADVSRWFFWAMGDRSSEPFITTTAATSVGVGSATLNGNILATGGSDPTVRGFAYGTNSSLAVTIATTTESGTFSAGTFSRDISGLLAGVTYYARAYSTNTTGTGYGNIVSFTTGTDGVPNRVIRLFEGFVLKILSGKFILFQR